MTDKFFCQTCGSIFDRENMEERLGFVGNPGSDHPVLTEIKTCPKCPSSNIGPYHGGKLVKDDVKRKYVER